MIVGVADTHAVIWYMSADPRLSKTARMFMDSAAAQGNKLGISSITLVEIVYLIEKGRIPAESLTRLVAFLNDPLSAFTEVPLDLSVVRVLPQISSDQVPDMPDRIIAATAFYLQTPLVSRDAKIRASSLQTIW